MSSKVILKSSDGESFEVDSAVASKSQTLKCMIDADSTSTVFSLPNVTAKILTKVIEYCKRHVAVANSNDPNLDKELKSFDEEFVKVDQETLFGLVPAAKYLEIESLFDLMCQTIADMMKGKSPEEIRKTFNIKNDFTPEKEEQVRNENRWAYE